MKALIFSCLLLSVYCHATSAPKLLLAEVYQDNIAVNQYWISEKLDGVRAYWNGRQLISRSGKVFNAPVWFTEKFPQRALDGELYLGRGQFAQTISMLSPHNQTAQDWQKLHYYVFELPNGQGDFSARLKQLKQIVEEQHSPYLKLVPQFRLQSKEQLFFKLDEVVKQGGEGLMLHYAKALYVTGRSEDLLKLKPYQDDEATVLAYRLGKGKYHGLIGSLIVKNKSGKIFAVGSGLTDAMRQNPPAIGSIITYQYNGLTKNGLPRFARFLRMYPKN